MRRSSAWVAANVPRCYRRCRLATDATDMLRARMDRRWRKAVVIDKGRRRQRQGRRGDSGDGRSMPWQARQVHRR
ncbi:hypothetical protein ACLOJK_007011 [Asimina triloba]